MNIRDKLKFLDQIETHSVQAATIQQSEFSIEKILPGQEIDSAFSVSHQFDITYQHGSIRLDQIESIEPNCLSLAGNDENLQQLDLRNTLFFDAETTGLAGGSGTYIFLAGCGYFVENKFIIKQFFMRDFPEELKMLLAVSKLAAQFDSIISFNGKSYDWPLLKSRFTLNRIEHPITDPLHFDLLHASRRIWKNCLTDCSLGTIERSVLEVFRNGDIPSYLIPQMYFEYLRSRDARPLLPVFYHNKIDILSLVSLTIKLHQIHQSPLHNLSKRSELLTLAHHYENMNQWERIVPIYLTLLKNETDSVQKKDIAIKLGYCYKRLGLNQQAAELWQTILKEGNFRIEPYEELAKYYEHHVNDLERAQQIVQTALNNINLLEQIRPASPASNYKISLQYRLNRIQTKLKNK